MLRRARIGLVSLAVALGAVIGLAAAAPAQATSYNGVCELHEVCLYWGTNYNGGVADFYNEIYNYKSFTFKGVGGGAGQNLNDNSESVRNRAMLDDCYLYVDSFMRGNYTVLGPSTSVPNLGSLDNRLSSHQFSA